ncbi:hypothetical protein [Herbaspirillum huttiense]|uniref:hypothetical protein n=1 Tax=Herbaspirillum huttiense TaxID=863372 RepID=UPI002E798D58|nr:hypothetical protein [Herbaspirillum huttiense]MEE1636357.1 hypothetical protein [Herbaspirillum huttiense NC40101]
MNTFTAKISMEGPTGEVLAVVTNPEEATPALQAFYLAASAICNAGAMERIRAEIEEMGRKGRVLN